MITDARRREMEDFLQQQIPLTRAMRVRVEDEDLRGLTLSAPLEENHNHLGTAFGGSLAALMMLAGYVFLWLELNNRDAHIVISKSRIKFRSPVRNTLRAVCVRPTPEELEKFRVDFGTEGKAKISLEVSIEQDGQAAANLEGVYVALASVGGQEPGEENKAR
ncbi:MAG TPA: YiiD C-terminal domain-containing protein [Chthoniobacterales bacterium]|jgi:thioesterase domain-containing protein